MEQLKTARYPILAQTIDELASKEQGNFFSIDFNGSVVFQADDMRIQLWVSTTVNELAIIDHDCDQCIKEDKLTMELSEEARHKIKQGVDFCQANFTTQVLSDGRIVEVELEGNTVELDLSTHVQAFNLDFTFQTEALAILDANRPF